MKLRWFGFAFYGWNHIGFRTSWYINIWLNLKNGKRRNPSATCFPIWAFTHAHFVHATSHATANVISNDTPLSTSYRRLSGPSSSASATPLATSPTFKRNKLVRASFKMLGSRWKPSSMSNGGDKNDNSPAKRETTSKTDCVSERFGKEFNRNVKKCVTDTATKRAPPPPTATTTTTTMPQSIKNKTNFFYAFTAKENVNTKAMAPFPSDIPVNVAPKAAALLQIPICPKQNFQFIEKPLRMDPSVCNLIANSKQFKLLKTLTQSNDNGADNNREAVTATVAVGEKRSSEYDAFQPATVRRTPYWTNHFTHSKTILNTKTTLSVLVELP